MVFTDIQFYDLSDPHVPKFPKVVLVNRIFFDFQMQFNWFTRLGWFFDNFYFKLVV